MPNQYSAVHYLNRELSLLKFNWRVLAQAEDERLPLLERLKFLCILSSNLDEFFEVRVAFLKENVRLNTSIVGADGLSSRQQLQQISAEAHELVARQYRILRNVMFPALADKGIHFLRRTTWNEPQKEWVKEFFFHSCAVPPGTNRRRNG